MKTLKHSNSWLLAHEEMLVENPLETLQHMGGCALSCEFKLLVSQNDYGPYLLSVYFCAPHQGLPIGEVSSIEKHLSLYHVKMMLHPILFINNNFHSIYFLGLGKNIFENIIKNSSEIRLNFDCSSVPLITSLHKSVWAPPNNYLHMSAIFRKGVKTQMILWHNLYVKLYFKYFEFKHSISYFKS